MSVSQDVVVAFRERLHALFPDVNIYSDTVEQGAIEPCFLVRVLSLRRVARLNETHFLARFHVNVVYLDEKASHNDLMSVSEELIFGLNDFSPGSGGWWLRSIDDSAQMSMEDDSISYVATYDVPVYRNEETAEPFETAWLVEKIWDDVYDFTHVNQDIKEREAWAETQDKSGESASGDDSVGLMEEAKNLWRLK